MIKRLLTIEEIEAKYNDNIDARMKEAYVKNRDKIIQFLDKRGINKNLDLTNIIGKAVVFLLSNGDERQKIEKNIRECIIEKNDTSLKKLYPVFADKKLLMGVVF